MLPSNKTFPCGKNDYRIINMSPTPLHLIRRFLITAMIFLYISVAAAIAQQPEPVLTYTGKVTVGQLFDEIQARMKITLVFEGSVVNYKRRIEVSFKKATLKEVMDKVAGELKVGWSRKYDDVVVLFSKGSSGETGEDPVVAATWAVRGTVVDDKGQAVPGVTIKVRGTMKGASADGDGHFVIAGLSDSAVLMFSSVGFLSKEVRVSKGENERVDVALEPSVMEVKEVKVYSTGYQNVPAERATGSFGFVGNKLYNRSNSPNILERINGVANSVLFTPRPFEQDDISVRNRITIYADTRPLIIVDNFEYPGDVTDLNPNDVENITILRDAAAASIWGAKAGNGVIVVTMKKGRYNTKPRVSFNSNLTIGELPNLSAQKDMSPVDYIEVERYLFDQGFYDAQIEDPLYPALSPVVEILLKHRNQQISTDEMETQISSLKKFNVNDDLKRYLYRNAITQQYALNVSGGSRHHLYYFSVGYDRNNNYQAENNTGRLTIVARNSFLLAKDKLEITTGLFYIQNRERDINRARLNYYPYSKLTDNMGNSISIPALRQSYIDTAGGGKLLDWNLRFLDEMHNMNNLNVHNDYRINVGLRYQILNPLSLEAKYQFSRGLTDYKEHYSEATYFTRDLINQFTQIDWTTGNVIYGLPRGEILYNREENYRAHNLRLQANYSNIWGRHMLAAIAGGELRSMDADQSSGWIYGVVNGVGSEIDDEKMYPNYLTGAMQRIPYGTDSQLWVSDRDISYFANLAYTFNGKYIFSASSRRDASNIFGVETNKKWVPLWSIGASWNLSEEQFYNSAWLPWIKLRMTYGFNGNVDKSTSAYLTAFFSGTNTYGSPQGSVSIPPNPNLKWEKVRIMNFGLDFETKGGKVSGTLEYYRKHGLDLLGEGILSPSTGFTTFYGNVADIRGKGVDVAIHSRNITRNFKWSTSLLFSYAAEEVSDYKMELTSPFTFLQGGVTPNIGRPVNAIYAYPWAGLDPENGDPIVYDKLGKSKDYQAILSDVANLKYIGPARPQIFGNMLNVFSYKAVELSLNITYKIGYYFRQESIEYNELIINRNGHSDYAKRWQEPGDELKTSVPSRTYPADLNRDMVYRYSTALVEKGDHIRLQSLQLGYDIKRNWKRLPFKAMQCYAFANNLGIIWKASKNQLDPDLVDFIPRPRTYSLGIRADF